MDIFYIKKSEFLPNILLDSLNNFVEGREFKSETKKIEHLLGRFLVHFIAKTIYDINNATIEIIDNKPQFVSRELYFSISHSEDIVLVAFNHTNIGVDVEYMKDKSDYSSIMNRYGEYTSNPTKIEFYRFWTLHEAEIKLQGEIESLFSGIIEDDYMLACASDDVMVSSLKLKKISVCGQNIDLTKELQNPKNVAITSL